MKDFLLLWEVTFLDLSESDLKLLTTDTVLELCQKGGMKKEEPGITNELIIFASSTMSHPLQYDSG